MPTTAPRLTARAAVFKAMGHPTRLAIIEELAAGERCVRELHGAVGSDMSTVSKHLSVLRHAGLVADERRANQIFYTLRAPCILSFFGCLEQVVGTDIRGSGGA